MITMIDDLSTANAKANIYLNVVVRINEDYGELLGHLKDMDLRRLYLTNFELSLSLGCTQPLTTITTYCELLEKSPLPADPYDKVDYDTFRAWLTVYEVIMRDQGLIGTRPVGLMGEGEL